jgi:hypothetical protein
MNLITLPLLKPAPDPDPLRQGLRWAIALVWLINGLWCKVLGQVPRHEAIAARVLGIDDTGGLIKLIGWSEILMAGWVFSRIQPRLNAWVQIGIVTLMNVLEFLLAPDLLLFGRVNALLAAGFVGLVYWHSAVPVKQQPA